MTNEIAWTQVRLALISRRNLGNGTPMLVVLNAFLKSIKPKISSSEQIKQIFRVPEKYAHKLRCRKGEKFLLEIDFIGANESWQTAWIEAMQRYIAENEHAGFDLADAPQWQIQKLDKALFGTVHDVKNAFSTQPQPLHAELEFLSPLPFKRETGSARTQLSAEQFFAQLSKRAEQLFGIKFVLPNLEAVELQSNHWHYTELRHASKSQPGHTQYFNGCFGSIYFSGNLSQIIPWLSLAQTIHAGGSVELNPLGYCRLHIPARPRLDEKLQQDSAWQSALLRVQESHDDWEQHVVLEQGMPFNPQAYCVKIIHNIWQENWQPAPALAFNIPKRNGIRRVEKLAHTELLIHTVLHEQLSQPIDRTLESSAVGFRRGHSVQTAVDKVRELLRQGYRFVVESDIEDFFPAVNLDRMEMLLDKVLPPADIQTRRLIGKLLHAGYIENGTLRARTIGLAQGSPLSPLLANLYLDRFDEAFNELDAKLIRYADDFVILARSRESAQTLLDLAKSELNEIGLQISAEKTAIRSIEDGFHFLGQPFGGQAEDTIANCLIPPAKKSIYITEPGCYLGHNGDALEIRRDTKLVDTIPLRRVADIAILAQTSLSSGLIQKCAKLGIPLTMTLGDGYHIASLPPDSRRHQDIAAAQAVHYAKLTPTERLILAKGFAAAKIANYRPLISARYVKGSVDTLQTLIDCIDGIESAEDVNAVRGHEGRAAKLMFATLNSYIKVPAFNFKKRLRDQPDRMNVLFNFAYYLLFSRLNTMVRAAGLNPYQGFLHDGADDYETLVCDIEELFRAPLDRHLIALVNLRIIKEHDFSERDGKLRLAPLAIKRFLEQFEKLLHSDVGGLSLLDTMQAQVHAFKRYVSEDQPLWYFSYRSEEKSSLLDTPIDAAQQAENDAQDDAPFDSAQDDEP